MTAFLAEQCQNGSRDYRSGFLIFFEAPKNKRITWSTILAELYALMKCLSTCHMLRGFWKDNSGAMLVFTYVQMLITL